MIFDCRPNPLQLQPWRHLVSEEKTNGLLKQLLKTLGLVGVIVLVLAVVGFGLLVGVCGILGRR